MTLTQIRNWAHDLMAPIAFLSLLVGALQQGLAQYFPDISTKYSPQLMAIGGALLALSKGIDSVNNWQLAKANATKA